MNGSFMTRAPTKHKHFHGIVAAHAMSPVVCFLESDVRFYIVVGDPNIFEPGVYVFQRWR